MQLSLGLDYKQGGFVDRAFQAFSEVTKIDPDNKYALLNLEKLHEEQQQWREARAIRRRLTDIADETGKPRDQAILAFIENELGLQAVRRGEPQEAIAHFGSALDLDDGAVPASLNLGDVHMRGGRPREAIAVWEQILDKAPERAYLTFESVAGGVRAGGRAGALPQPVRAAHRRQPAGLARAARPRPARPRRRRRGCGAGARPAARVAAPQPPRARRPSGHLAHAGSAGVPPVTPVRRYLELTRRVVFYLDPHVCTRCRYRSTELLWQCPQCHEWNTFVEERPAQAENVVEASA